MIDLQFVNGGVCAAEGFLAAGVHCGIRKNHTKKDLALLVSSVPCAAAAAYTQNKVFGAPITVTRAHLQNGVAQAVVCNSGNANTCNSDGVEKADRMCALVAEATGLDPDDVIVASTGVIGQPIDMAPIAAGIRQLAPLLSPAGAQDAAEAILTTDTKVKEIACRCRIGGKIVTVGAIAKGSGMIHPNMATMLSFVTTDAAITAPMLHRALLKTVEDTFNMISIDGDTSTNDMVSIMASGLAGNPVIAQAGAEYEAFCTLLAAVLTRISKMIAGDGEGATRLLTCNVVSAPTKALARSIAKSVICSNLVKAALFGADANWGRILCAIGYTPGDFSVEGVDVFLSSSAGKIHVCSQGAGIPFSEQAAKAVLSAGEITFDIDLHDGAESATAWGCDLTYDYVKINGDYRT